MTGTYTYPLHPPELPLPGAAGLALHLWTLELYVSGDLDDVLPVTSADLMALPLTLPDLYGFVLAVQDLLGDVPPFTVKRSEDGGVWTVADNGARRMIWEGKQLAVVGEMERHLS